MKTVKFVLIAVLVATAMVNSASADGFKGKPKKSVSITYDGAIKNPELVSAMYQQLDSKFLDNIEQLYVVEVDYHGACYRILGSRQDWISFFRHMWIPPGSSKLFLTSCSNG